MLRTCLFGARVFIIGAACLLIWSPRVLAADQADLVQYAEDIKPVNERIDAGDYEAACSRAMILKEKYPELIGAKLSNIDHIVALRKRCIERVNSGAAKVAMGDFSKRYAFAGEVAKADESAVTAKIKKTWDVFKKEEIGEFYRKASDPNSPEDLVGLAAFLMEGTVDEKAIEAALDPLGKALGMGYDAKALVAYAETLKRAQKEFAEAAEKGKALETAETAKAPSAPRTEQKEEKAGKEKEESAKSASSAVKSFDGVYVTTAATGEKIPHPLSRKTYTIRYGGKNIKVPEGMVYVPPGDFIMGVGTEPPEGPAHKVYLDGYSIGKYEVTNAEWKAFMEATSLVQPDYLVDGIPKGRENYPAAKISWETAKNFCSWVSEKTGRHVQLPTEAQWEKAARGRKAFKYPWGNEWDQLLCNWGGRMVPLGFELTGDWQEWQRRRGEWGRKTGKGVEMISLGGNTMPVGSFRRNKSQFGCYDMAGNVSEWCADWYKGDYYIGSPERNPEGPAEEDAKKYSDGTRIPASRGGGWWDMQYHQTATDRLSYSQSGHWGAGFRIVCIPESR